MRQGKAKILLLAPDCESSDVLGGKLQALVQLCGERNVQVMYCLNRRKLGKAVGSSMRQMVVCVLDPDGAYDKYKKIMKFCRPAEATGAM